MDPCTAKFGASHILYDGDTPGKIDNLWFDPRYWEQQQAILGTARGRGSTWMIRSNGDELVLRHYRRGGLLAPLLGDRYLWCGLGRTRAWREWRLLADMQREGLPVPSPVAARVVRHGLIYTADLITRRLPGADSLAQHLSREALSAQRWRSIGVCLRRFHINGVCHADLNAHNILLDADGVYLIDFDKGRRRRPGRWQRANLARLQRSLAKLGNQHSGFAFSAADWQALLQGYHSGQTS